MRKGHPLAYHGTVSVPQQRGKDEVWSERDTVQTQEFLYVSAEQDHINERICFSSTTAPSQAQNKASVYQGSPMWQLPTPFPVAANSGGAPTQHGFC